MQQHHIAITHEVSVNAEFDITQDRARVRLANEQRATVVKFLAHLMRVEKLHLASNWIDAEC